MLDGMSVPLTSYASRLQQAMRDAGRDPDDTNSIGWLAEQLRVSYQAAKKAVDGATKALTAENNVRAARALGVNSEWLATGEGSRAAVGLPISAELLRALLAAPAGLRRQAENAARNVLDMDPLPREAAPGGDSAGLGKASGALAA